MYTRSLCTHIFCMHIFPSSYLFFPKFTDVSGSRWRIQFVCELAIFVNWHSTIPANYAAARSIRVRALMCARVIICSMRRSSRRMPFALASRTCACRVNCVGSLSHEGRSERGVTRKECRLISQRGNKFVSREESLRSKFILIPSLQSF